MGGVPTNLLDFDQPWTINVYIYKHLNIGALRLFDDHHSCSMKNGKGMPDFIRESSESCLAWLFNFSREKHLLETKGTCGGERHVAGISIRTNTNSLRLYSPLSYPSMLYFDAKKLGQEDRKLR